MAIQMKRRNAELDAEAAMARLQELAREQKERLEPYAGQARAGAERGLLRARGWTAPRLETAALRVEDTVAPRVADLLATAAQRVEPNRTRRGLIAARHGGRRVPRAVVLVGVAALGAATVYGVIRLRKAAQDAEWQENLDQAREQVRETREQLQSKAHDAKEAAKAKTEEVAGVGAGPEADGAAKK